MAWFSNIFHGKKKNLKKVSVDELRREQIKLTQEERKLVAKVDEIEAKKKAIFNQGLNEGSEAKKRILARDFKVQDSKLLSLERTLKIFSKQIRILNGFLSIKENEKLFQTMGISKLINNMDIVKLQEYVEAATTEGEFMMEKFSSILSVMEDQEAALGEFSNDHDIEEIMDVWRDMESVDDEEKAMAEGMKKLEEKKEAQAEEI